MCHSLQLAPFFNNLSKLEKGANGTLTNGVTGSQIDRQDRQIDRYKLMERQIVWLIDRKIDEDRIIDKYMDSKKIFYRRINLKKNRLLDRHIRI